LLPSRSRALLCALSLLLIACGGPGARTTADTVRVATEAATAGPIDLTDDLGATIHLTRPAKRIVSLIPSATESLIAIGAAPLLVGRTRYDTASAIASIPSVGGGIDPSLEAIVQLEPDLVVGWGTDARAGLRARLASAGIPMFSLATEDTTDIFRGIRNLGRLTGRDSAAGDVARSIRATLDSVRQSVAGKPTARVMYVVFADPPMTAGPRTFIGQLIGLAGGKSIFDDVSANWPNVAMEEIVRRDPDLLIVPVGEFKQNTLERFRGLAGWRSLRAVRDRRVVAVSADLLSRPSPSIAQSAKVLRDAIHPDLVSAAPGAR
jgi:iron complex transport system substrate-binding protein